MNAIEPMSQRNAEMAEARSAVAKARALRPKPKESKSKKNARVKCWSRPKGNPRYTTCYDTKTGKQLRKKTVPRRPPKPPPPPSRETQMNILKNFNPSKYVFY
jgi:hypothetical protein